MQKTLLVKMLVIFGLTLLIAIPLAMIDSTIRERNTFREQAVASIAADSVREQTVAGPVLVVPYTEEYEEAVAVAAAGAVPARTELVKRRIERRQFIFPNELHIDGTIDTARRYRGIHKVLVYGGTYGFKGDFVLPPEAELARSQPNSRIAFGKRFVALAIEDVRGIRNAPSIMLDGKTSAFQQGSGLASMKSGVHADLGQAAPAENARLAFSFELRLDGIERQHFVPLGRNNQVSLASNWPHPQFGGRFLPLTAGRSIGKDGFKAAWDISSLATDAQAQLVRSENAGQAEQKAPVIDRFSVGFIEPVNVYSMAERATKYGLLFVALTFAAFFLFETLKRLPVHPIQYLLVGLALALFFLLLVGLSEHIAFELAYAVASAACIVLIGFYLSYVLRDRIRGVGFGAALALLYSALYGLLISESNALVLGSLLLFALLAAVMVATRKVDWYQVGKPEQGAKDAA